MRLNAPTIPVFMLSVLLVIAVVVVRYFEKDIPFASALIKFGLFEILLVAYGILFLGNVLRRF